MKHLVLMGFMGSGKSTIGKMLEKRTGLSYADTDLLIEEKEARSIEEIFRDEGEEYFRNAETTVLEELLKRKDRMIISLGGGTALNEKNRKMLKNNGGTVFLKISPLEACKRLKGDQKRPLLRTADPEKRIEKLIKVRNPIYQAAADYVLEETGKTPEDICREILDWLNISEEEKTQ